MIYDFFDSIAATINLLIFAIGLRLHETVRVKKALLNNRIFSIFANLNLNMKITELHRIIRQNGWIPLPRRGKGSHVRYVKDGRIYTVPKQKSKEIDNFFAKKILKALEIL